MNTHFISDSINNSNKNNQLNGQIKPSKFLYYLTYLTAIVISLLKAYILISLWPFIEKTNIEDYLNRITKDDFGYSKSILYGVMGITNFAGVLLLVGDVFFSFFSRRSILLNNNDQLEKSLSKMIYNFIIPPLAQGLIPEFILTLNNIQLEKDANFFNYVYWFRNKFLVILVIIYVIVFFGMCFSMMQGPQVGVQITSVGGVVTSTAPLMAGETLVGAISGGVGATSGGICGFPKLALIYALFAFGIFPFFLGLTSYVYLLFYLKDLKLKIVYNLEFLLNFTFIFLYFHSQNI
jgi:hypothetical protein